MIREAQRSELPAILELWLESTTWGHPFRVEFYSSGNVNAPTLQMQLMLVQTGEIIWSGKGAVSQQ